MAKFFPIYKILTIFLTFHNFICRNEIAHFYISDAGTWPQAAFIQTSNNSSEKCCQGNNVNSSLRRDFTHDHLVSLKATK